MMKFGIITFCILTILIKQRRCDRIPLYVGGLFELTKHWWISYTNFFPSIVEFVFETVRERNDILPEYELVLVKKDTQGKNGLAGRRLTELVTEDPPKVAIIGPSLSDELTVTGQMAPFYNIIELSYVATTSSTIDRKLFPTLYKVNQIMDNLNPLRIEMMKHFDWTRVGTLFYQDDMSASQMSLFHDLVEDNNMTLLTSAVISETSGMKQIIARLKQFDVRIIMAAFRSNIAPEVFCEAYHQGLYGESHVWILAGPTMYPNWIANSADEATMGCTKEELIIASNGHFTLDYVKLSKSNLPSISGQTADEVMKLLVSLAEPTPYKLSSYAGWIYDTAWALALGLNNSITYLEKDGLHLHDYNYSSVFVNAVSKGMHDVVFRGISGPVAFDEYGGRIGVTYIQQNFNDTRTDVASYDHLTGNLTWIVPVSTLWNGGHIPKDEFTYTEYVVPTSMTAYVVIVTITCVGILLTFFFLMFNVYNRNKSMIKMSSPMLNTLILFGCLLMYLVVLVMAIDYRHLVDSDMCMVHSWLMSVGFTCVFGALFSKTYRIYVIFRDYKFKRKTIKDYHLFGMVGILLLIDCVILIPWTSFYSLRMVKHVENSVNRLDANIIFSEVYNYCYNPEESYWFAAIYVYKGLLLAFGTFLAWETRHVNVSALNDSKYIGACIYNVVIMCLFGAPLAHVLPIDEKTLLFVVESILIVFCTTSCQCILFVPKILSRNQVHGKFLTTNASSKSPTVSANLSREPSGYGTGNDDKRSPEELKIENAQLKMDIARESIALAKLRKSVLQATGNVHFYKSGSGYIVFRSTNKSSKGEEIFENEV